MDDEWRRLEAGRNLRHICETCGSAMEAARASLQHVRIGTSREDGLETLVIHLRTLSFRANFGHVLAF